VSYVIDRQSVNRLVDPIIKYQTYRFCRKYCNDLHFQYQCTLPERPYSPPKQKTLYCEWGNASYGWMLNDLTKESRLDKFEGETEKQLGNYFYTIANSLPFFERWKDWRFGRRKNVPVYIQEISDDASKIFYGLCNKDPIAIIAQKINQSEKSVAQTADKIIITLTEKGKLSLLQSATEVSLSNTSDHENDSQPAVMDLPTTETEPSKLAFHAELRKVFSALDATEKFVVENMVMDEYSAREVLAALQASNISLKPGLAVQDMNQQHVFYFLRKTLNKLKVKVKNS